MGARKHLVQIWRNPATRQWNHRFNHGQNGEQLTRQSQNDGVKQKRTAVRSACTSYYLGDPEDWTLVDEPGAGVTIWSTPARDDVVVRIEDHR